MNKTQLEEVGFNINKELKFCEGLNFYTTNVLKGENFLSLSASLFEFVKSDIIKKECKIVYGTCSRDMKAMYTLLGYEVFDKKKSKNGTKYLLGLEIYAPEH